jgi:hypothetical protein
MSALDFWKAGHIITGFDGENGSPSLGMRKFRKFYGTTPEICEIIWKTFESRNCFPSKFPKPLHLLCGLLLLKVYGTEEVNSALSSVTEKTFRKWSRIYVELLAEELEEVVR